MPYVQGLEAGIVTGCCDVSCQGGHQLHILLKSTVWLTILMIAVVLPARATTAMCGARPPGGQGPLNEALEVLAGGVLMQIRPGGGLADSNPAIPVLKELQDARTRTSQPPNSAISAHRGRSHIFHVL